MAKFTDKNPSGAGDAPARGTATQNDDDRLAEKAEAAAEDREDRSTTAAYQAPVRRQRRGFFDMYKPGQGSNTRIGTALGMATLVCWFAYFLYEKLDLVSENRAVAQLWQVGISVGVLVGFGLLGYWILALNARANDFLIATEGEMKKVSWSTRKEIIGSTKVVVWVVVLLSVILFVVDVLFMAFFNSIGVLKGGGAGEAIRGLF